MTIFAGAGGSSMGYKLAGYRHLAAVECDPLMTDLYERNLGGRVFCEMVQDFKQRDLSEFSDVDLLDGSPPCSAFSMSGKRSERWGKASEWTEGGKVQVLEDLFMEFCDVVEVVRPKIVLAENVLGMICGKAKGYAKAVVRRLDGLGYSVQLFRLNAATMGVPQSRERVFFLAARRDLGLPRISLEFNDRPITVSEALTEADNTGPTTLKAARGNGKWGPWKIPPHWYELWAGAPIGTFLGSSVADNYLFNNGMLHPRRPARTLMADIRSASWHWAEPRILTDRELIVLQTFPQDFDFGETMPPRYVLGMSVPPVMMARIAQQVREQWFDQGTQANAA